MKGRDDGGQNKGVGKARRRERAERYTNEDLLCMSSSLSGLGSALVAGRVNDQMRDALPFGFEARLRRGAKGVVVVVVARSGGPDAATNRGPTVRWGK